MPDEAPLTTLEQREEIGLNDVLEAIAMQAVTSDTGSIRRRQSLAFAICGAGNDRQYSLLPQEIRLLSPRSCARKKLEFAAGRAAARLALGKIGLQTATPILRGERGEPLWPANVCGSITHCYPWSLAVAAQGSGVALGIDCESVERLREVSIIDVICTTAERDWVRGEDQPARLVKIFSAKEAVYKAFYPICKHYIDFKELELCWLDEQKCFQGRFLARLSPGLSEVLCKVYCRQSGSLIVSLVICDLRDSLGCADLSTN